MQDALSPGLITYAECEAVIAAARPLYHGTTVTPDAVDAACRVLYRGFDGYRPISKTHLRQEAAGILAAAATARERLVSTATD